MGLLNGMLGVSCMILPTLGIIAGYLPSVWVTIIVGYLLYYTAQIIVTHLGQAKDIKHSILAHFKNDYRYMIGYSMIIWFSMIPILLTVFQTACYQI